MVLFNTELKFCVCSCCGAGYLVVGFAIQIKRRGQGCAYGISVKRRSTFALFEGISDELVPYQVSPRYEYKPSIEDEKYITGLRQWHHGDELKGG